MALLGVAPLDTMRMDSRMLWKNTFYMSHHFKDRLADSGSNMFPVTTGVHSRIHELLVGVFA